MPVRDPSITQPSPWLAVPEVAARLRVSPDRVRKSLKHRIPHRQNEPRGPLYFHIRDVERYEAATTVQPISTFQPVR